MRRRQKGLWKHSEINSENAQPSEAARLSQDAAQLSQDAAQLPQDAAQLPQDAALLSQDVAQLPQDPVLPQSPREVKAAFAQAPPQENPSFNVSGNTDEGGEPAFRHISILGSCIARDVFSMHENDGGFKIDRFVQANSPVCLEAGSIFTLEICGETEKRIDELISALKSFDRRMLKVEWKKETFSYLAEAKSDFIILDTVTLRWDMLRHCSELNSYITTYFRKEINALLKEGLIYPDAEEISLFQIPDEEFEGYMENYVRHVLELYDESCIILLEVAPVPFAAGKSVITTFDEARNRKWEANLARGFAFLKKRLPGAHVIEFPQGVLADEHHKWGRAPLHFVQEYYDYSLEAVEIITGRFLSPDAEKASLKELKEKYNEIFRQKYTPLFVKYINDLREKERLCTKMTRYESYFKKLLLDKEKINSIRKFFITGRYNHCALYGLNQISEVFISMFSRWAVETDFIVEEKSEANYKGIPVVKRSQRTFPETQVMIITDVVITQKIKDRLGAMKLSYPYFDIYEIMDAQKAQAVPQKLPPSSGGGA